MTMALAMAMASSCSSISIVPSARTRSRSSGSRRSSSRAGQEEGPKAMRMHPRSFEVSRCCICSLPSLCSNAKKGFDKDQSRQYSNGNRCCGLRSRSKSTSSGVRVARAAAELKEEEVAEEEDHEGEDGARCRESSLKKFSSAVVMPMLAVALVGSGQPAVHASEWDRFLVPVDETESSSGDTGYGELVQSIKAARENTATASDPGSITNSSPFLKSSAPKSSPPPAAAPTPEIQEVAPPPQPPAPSPLPPPPSRAATTPPVGKQSPVESVIPREEPKVEDVDSQVDVPSSKKTHGVLPLFLSQFLLLVAAVGGGYVLIITPESKWEDLQKTVDGYVQKATPVLEDSWTKAKPVASQVQQKVVEFSATAKPYLVKAWEASKPLAAKAAEAAKPIIEGAQAKAVEIFWQSKSDK